MIRNLKALGLALVAVLALGAVLASGASAQQGHLTVEGEGSATLNGTEITEGSENLGSFEDTVRCPGSTYTGYEYNVTPHEPVPNNATTATIVPDYKQGSSNCREGNSNFPATVFTNECDYVVHVGETTPEEEHVYQAKFDIVCENESHIDVRVYLGTSHGFEVCHLVIGEQSNLEGADIIHNTVGDDIEIKGTVEGIKVTRSGLCVEGGITEDPNGSFKVNSTITGENGLGPVNVTVTD